MYFIFIILFFSIPIYAFGRMLQSLRTKLSSNNSAPVKVRKMDILVFFLSYFLIFIGFFLNTYGEKAGVPLEHYADTGVFLNGYASLNNEILLGVLVLLILSIAAYWMLSTHLERLSPIVYMLSSSVLILHIVFTIVYITHTGFSHYNDTFMIALSIIFLQAGYASLSFLYVGKLKEALDYFQKSQQEQGTDHYNRFLLFLYRISSRYQKMSVLWLLFTIPVFIILQFLLIFFGQRPDSFIRVFLDTSSFHYSKIPAPKPEVIPGDGHYLCTVSASGHKKIVKPVRAGVRHGSRIVVNRQLLIANAFENVLEEYTPTCHRKIRSFYDKYGYPLSKHIQKKGTADIVYLFMKPLEWFFLLVLYAVDKNPENRIHVQYSELRK